MPNKSPDTFKYIDTVMNDNLDLAEELSTISQLIFNEKVDSAVNDGFDFALEDLSIAPGSHGKYLNFATAFSEMIPYTINLLSRKAITTLTPEVFNFLLEISKPKYERLKFNPITKDPDELKFISLLLGKLKFRERYLNTYKSQGVAPTNGIVAYKPGFYVWPWEIVKPKDMDSGVFNSQLSRLLIIAKTIANAPTPALGVYHFAKSMLISTAINAGTAFLGRQLYKFAPKNIKAIINMFF